MSQYRPKKPKKISARAEEAILRMADEDRRVEDALAEELARTQGARKLDDEQQAAAKLRARSSSAWRGGEDPYGTEWSERAARVLESEIDRRAAERVRLAEAEGVRVRREYAHLCEMMRDDLKRAQKVLAGQDPVVEKLEEKVRVLEDNLRYADEAITNAHALMDLSEIPQAMNLRDRMELFLVELTQARNFAESARKAFDDEKSRNEELSAALADECRSHQALIKSRRPWWAFWRRS